jgi:hypothetical protein
MGDSGCGLRVASYGFRVAGKKDIAHEREPLAKNTASLIEKETLTM